MSLPSAVSAVDDLYRTAVMEPDHCSELSVSDWAEALAASGTVAREDLRHVRRAMRVALKLAGFWGSADPARRSAETDWMTRVDIASGPPAWRPTLELARAALEREPSPELFEHVAQRFRLVTNQPFAGGADFDSWLGDRAR